MAIFKAKVPSNFAQIPNDTAQDSRLSFEARGLLTLILSMPDDWVIHKEWLIKQSPKCGRDKMTRLLRELIDYGYVVKKAKHEEGQLNGVDWLVYAEPHSGELKNSRTEYLSDCKSNTIKETSLKRNNSTNKHSLRIDKSNTSIFSKDLKDSSRKFINQLSQSDYPLCFIAMDELCYLKNEYQNIYLGSQTIDTWGEAESILREICGTDEAMGMSEEEVVSTFVRVTYMKRCLNNKNEVGLPFMIGLIAKVGAESAVNPDHIDLLNEDY